MKVLSDKRGRPDVKRNSEATWRAFYSMLGPYATANFILIGMLALFVFKPSVNDPSTYWTMAVMVIMILVAGGFIVKGTLRHKSILKSAEQDRKRLAAGLPLDPEDPEDTKA
jgi:hypothetical protein